MEIVRKVIHPFLVHVEIIWFCSTGSYATTIMILSSTLAGSIADGDGDDDLNTFYQNEGFSSSIITGTISDPELSNVDLFVAMLPNDGFGTSEITALTNYLATGGRILFMGEQNSFAPTENNFINGALSDLGSSMLLGASSIDSGFNDTSAGQILPHPFNSSVNLVNYGNVNSISGIPPGNELFLAKDLSTPWGGVELVGNGTMIVLADTNMISHIEDTAGNDNHLFFTNIVPEPNGAFVIGLGAAVAVIAMRCRHKSYHLRPLSNSRGP